eukprot:6069112-Pyramimonas_sp.AAC.1
MAAEPIRLAVSPNLIDQGLPAPVMGVGAETARPELRALTCSAHCGLFSLGCDERERCRRSGR